MHARQILKAPKRSREYAEYWPEKADAALIVRARQNALKLLDAEKPVAVVRNGRWTGVRGHWERSAELRRLRPGVQSLRGVRRRKLRRADARRRMHELPV